MNTGNRFLGGNHNACGCTRWSPQVERLLKALVPCDDPRWVIFPWVLLGPPNIWSFPTCEGDLGRAGAGDAGASVWFGLAVGLGRGEGSSGGDGVFAMRKGPESLQEHRGWIMSSSKETLSIDLISTPERFCSTTGTVGILLPPSTLTGC